MEFKANQNQIKAINHFSGPCLCIAGPGTGKTAVITQRTRNLIEKYGVDPSNILVITFTKSAALEMKNRFMSLMGISSTRVTFGTFHAVFFMILKHAYHLDVTNIINDDTKQELMREIVSRYHLEYRDENEFITCLLGEIGKIKNNRINLDQFESAQCGKDTFKKIYEDYNKRLKGQRLIDFDDMLSLTYELFEQRKDLLKVWQDKYSYILIDEFQDINNVQMDVIDMLAGKKQNLFIVGDDDQSIYAFRGSKPDIMLKFPEVYKDCSKIVLDVNYRSDGNITRDALKLISHNENRFDKDIKCSNQTKHPVYYKTFDNVNDENKYIVAEIKKSLERGESLNDTAILSRTNTGAVALSEVLLCNNIFYRTREKIPNLYDHWAVKDIFAYIRLARGSRRRKDILMIMNRPNRYIGRDSLESDQIDFDRWLAYYSNHRWIEEKVEKLIMDINLLSKMSPYSAINFIRKGMGYDDYISEFAAKRNLDKEDLYDILDELLATARGFESFDKWNDHIKTYSQNLKKQKESKNQLKNAITLSTLHSSKGLEYKNVFILDANEGVMPYRKAVLKNDIEEERRLFYVGMTRAKNRLHICSVKSQKEKETEVSRFVKEAMSS